MIFPDNVVIDKQNLHRASEVLHQALSGKNVPFQITVADIATMRDGRFNSYDETFRDYFNGEARITGPDYRSEITYELPTMNEQVPVRFNLKKMRNGLLFAEHDIKENYTLFLHKFNKSLDAASRGSKQILYFVDGKLRKNRFSAIEAIGKTFPEVDVEPLLRIRKAYHNPQELDKIYRKPQEALALWNSAVTFMEEMIREYLERNPRN